MSTHSGHLSEYAQWVSRAARNRVALVQADAALMAKTRDEAARRSRPTTPAAPRVPPDVVGESAEMLAALEAVHRCDALLRDAESRAPADRAELPGQYPSTWDVE